MATHPPRQQIPEPNRSIIRWFSILAHSRDVGRLSNSEDASRERTDERRACRDHCTCRADECNSPLQGREPAGRKARGGFACADDAR